MWLLWYPAASSEGTLKSFQARRHAYACSMFWVCSGVSSPQQIHIAVPEAGPLFSSKRHKEANSSCYLIFPTADKDWNLNWLMSEIHHLWWRCPAAEPYTGSGKSVREDKWQKRKSKLSSPDSGGVNYTPFKFKNPYISGAAYCKSARKEKKNRSCSARC